MSAKDFYDIANQLRDFLRGYGDKLEEAGRRDLSQIIEAVSLRGSAEMHTETQKAAPQTSNVRLVSVDRGVLIDLIRHLRTGQIDESARRQFGAALRAGLGPTDPLSTLEFRSTILASVRWSATDQAIRVIEAATELPVVRYVKDHVEDIAANLEIENAIGEKEAKRSEPV
ncbi:MAG: hypothetical protein E6R03_17000 [Hyphomicrobiaceae bacterium]|nr:MAG: hypothetical protein E6R03_17000 [Hyphomicrobiaceae bacterium]